VRATWRGRPTAVASPSPAQIYLLDIAGGGEAQRVTTVSTGARAPQFRPDGQAVLFVSGVFAGAADDEANRTRRCG
jgi:dipeptidyl aminopeptidase/acylaminoacyl peptidase